MSNSLTEIDFSILSDSLSKFSESMSKIVSFTMSDSFTEFLKYISKLCLLVSESFTKLSEPLVLFAGSDSFTNFSDSLTKLSESLNKFALLDMSDSFSILSGSITCDIQSTFLDIEPYLDEYIEQLPSGSETPITHIKSKNCLTRNDLYQFISILIILLTFIVSQLPNKQLKEISDQNKTLIAQNEDIICLEKEKLELSKQNAQACNAIIEAINTLTDKVDELNERPEIEESATPKIQGSETLQ
ncbi:MAG: hypothetical protein VB035_06075 [Candidatus Fimivivens sp.]|nr:hypothetical protein [Candidatus Fimivivens sp.]